MGHTREHIVRIANHVDKLNPDFVSYEFGQVRLKVETPRRGCALDGFPEGREGIELKFVSMQFALTGFYQNVSEVVHDG
jgi:hypothetical protein